MMSIDANDTVSTLGEARGGRRASIGIVLSALLMIAVPYAHLPSALRQLLVIAYVLTVPGWAVGRLLRIRSVALELSVALGLSVAMVILVAITLLDVHRWDAFTVYLLCLAVAALGGLIDLSRS